MTDDLVRVSLVYAVIQQHLYVNDHGWRRHPETWSGPVSEEIKV